MTPLELVIKAKGDFDAAFKTLSKSVEGATKEAQQATQQMSKLASEGMNAVNSAASGMAGNLGGLGSALSSLGPAGLAAAAGIGTALGTLTTIGAVLVDATKKAMAYGDNMAALADRTGLSTSALQQFEVQAKLGNSSIDGVVAAVNKMQIGMMKGSEGFKKLGLDVGRLVQMKPEDAFVAVAKAIEGLGTDSEKASARVAVFGKSGNELAGTLKAAAEGAGQLGGALSGEALSASGELQDKADLLAKAWERVQLQLGGAIAQSPQLQRAVSDLTNLVVKLATEIGQATPKIVDFINMTVSGAKAGGSFLRDILGGTSVTAATANAIGRFTGDAYVEGMREATAKMRDEVGFGDPTFGRAQVEAARKAAEEAAAAAGAAAAKAAADARKKLEAEHAASLKRQAREQERYTDLVIKESWRLENEVEKTLQAMTDRNAKEILQQYLDFREGVKQRREAMEEMADAMLEAVRRLRGDAFDGLASGLHQAVDIMNDLGISAESGLGKIAGLAAGTADMIANAAQRGFLTIADLVNQAKQIFQSGSVLGGAASGAMTGFAVGGPIGAGIGALAGGLLGLFGKAKQAREEMTKLKNEFVSSMGGMASLTAKAKEAGIALDAMFKAKSADALKKAIGDIKSQLDLWAEGQDKIREAMNEYGITVSEMGPKFAQQELDKQVAKVVEQFEILKIAGGDVNVIAEKMGPKVLDLVHQYQAAGLAIPEALRPVLEAMLANGQLVDENGKAYGSLEEAGIKFAESMSDALKGMMEQVRELVRVLAAGFHVPVNFEYNTGGGGAPTPGGGPGPKGGHLPEFATGGLFTQPTPGVVGEKGPEGLIPLSDPGAMRAIGGAIAEALGPYMAQAMSAHGGGGSAPVYLDRHLVGYALSDMSARGDFRVSASAVRGANPTALRPRS